MAVDLTTNPGGLFRRLGKICGFAKAIVTSQLAIDTSVDGILDQYEANRDFAITLETGRPGFKSSTGSPLTPLRLAAQKTVIEMVQADDPQNSKSFANAMQVVIDQMTAAGASIQNVTSAASVAADAGNTGTGKIVASVINLDGNNKAYIRPEVIDVECTADAQLSGTAGYEAFRVRGELAVSNLDPAWPDGSGASSSIVTANGATDGGAGIGQNMTTNGDFESFTSTAPDSWTIDTGAASIDSVATPMRGSTALKITGDGSTLTKLHQNFATGQILPNTKYCLGFWLRHSGSAPAAGVLRVSVQNASGTILSTSNVSVTLSGITSSYVFYSAEFQTSAILPTGLKVVIELTTAMTNARIIYLDELVVQQMQQVGGLGGPYLAAFAGPVDFKVGDLFTVTMTNSWATSNFAYQLDKMLDLYPLGLQIPSAGSPTISDSYVS